MYRYNNILVHLNMNADEKHVIEMAAKISHLAQSDKVIFSHYFEEVELSEEVKEKYPWLLEPFEDTLEKKVSEEVKTHFKGFAGTETEIRVGSGNTLYELLRIAKDEAIDLVITGKEMESHLAVRLARKAPCSVCIVPESCTVEFSNVLVPIDFSDFSKLALEVGIAFGSAQKLSSLTALYIARLPESSRAIGILPKDKIKKMNEDYFQGEMKSFLKEVDNKGLALEPSIVHGNYVSDEVNEFAGEHNHDLIVFGCRGKGAMSSLFIGSNAESLIESATVPLIAVKKKGVGISFIEKLLGES